MTAHSTVLSAKLINTWSVVDILRTTSDSTQTPGGKRSRLVASVVPRPGLALLHLHGDDCLEHEGAEVLAGVKYVLRSDVLY